MAQFATPHTVKAFDQELGKLNQTLARMGGLAEAQLSTALQAMVSGDHALIDQVIGGDDQVDEAEEDINEQVVRMIALRQPVADDLRTVMSSMKVATALERISDHATSTAYRVRKLQAGDAGPAVKSVARLGWLVVDMLKEALDTFMARDADRAVKVWQRDSEVDDLYSSLFRELLTYMMEDPRKITPCIHLMFIAKNLERVGDHATNLAETTYFIVHGTQLKEERPKRDVSSTTLIHPDMPDDTQV